ncbi:hypothetical protein [Kordia sp.]|uniref:hypothetical protein n=1 Tax=Kordia sp. TaxID=1965332 RepID=UPI003D2E0FB1
MLEDYSNSKNDIPIWQKFEQDVALLFKLFGYDQVTHNTKIIGGQCDVIAKSSKKN